MRRFKLLLAAFVITMSTTFYAYPMVEGEVRRGSVSYEIEKMLKDSNIIIEEEFTVTILFKVNDSKRIEIHSIKSPNEEVNEFLERRLENRKLTGQKWFRNKYYELPVKVEMR